MRLYVLIALVFFGASGCVYFNTFYNAQKYYRQAEKARQKHEEQHASWELEEGATEDYQVPRPQNADQLYDQAARKASRVLERYKESELVDDAMFLLGRSFYWRSEYLRAIQAFRDLETNFPDSEYFNRARYWRALCMEKQRIDSEAQQLYRALVEEAEEETAAQAGWRLGEMAYANEDYVAAAQEYRSALDAFPDASIRAALLLRLGSSLLALEDSTRYEEAVDTFFDVLRADPDRDQEYRARLNIGRALSIVGDVEGSLDAYDSLLKDGDFRAYEGRTRLLIGQHYQVRRDQERALAQYEKVRDDFPQSPASAMALYRTGLLYLQERGDTQLAREYFEETNIEKAGSQGARLAQVMLGHLARLESLQGSVHRADSLAADSLGAIAGPVLLVEGWQPPKREEDEGGAREGVEEESEKSEDEEGGDRVDVAIGVVEDDEGGAAEGEAAGEGGERDARFASDEFVVSHSLEVLDNLFTIAEVYRDLVGQADSSIAYYKEIIRRFPNSEQLPRAIYSMAWIHREMRRDEEGARPYLDQLVRDFSNSAHANEARALLGRALLTTDAERAAAEFAQIEALRMADPNALEDYVPLLDSLAARYAGSPIGAKALYLSAVAYEDVRGDTLQVDQRYRRLEEEFAETRYGEIALLRREARTDGSVAKLERSLKAVGGVLKPGEEMALLALEPDTLDSASLSRKYMGFALRADRRGDKSSARSYYERSLEEQLRNPRALNLLANLSWEEGFFSEATELYRQTLSFDPNNLQAHYRLFAIHISEAEEDSANSYLQQLLRRDASNPQIRYAREQYPAIVEGEALDIDQLVELAIVPPEVDLSLGTQDIALSDWPLVRSVVRPNVPAGMAVDSLEVLLDVLVDKAGRAQSVEVFRGDEPFAQAAINAAYEYEFYPALRTDGNEIKVWIELTIPFFSGQLAPDTTAVATPTTIDEGS